MKRSLRLAVWGLALANSLWAQRDTEVVVRQFVLNQVAVTTPSSEISNVGQTQHSIFVRLEDAPALTCTDVGLSVTLQQGVKFGDDPDTIVWTNLGLPVTATEYGATGSVYRSNTSGAVHSNLRVNPSAFDTVNCLLSVTYVGTVRPVALFDIGGSSWTNITILPANPSCPVNAYFVFYNTTDGVYQICANGVITDIGAGGGGSTQIVLSISDAVTLDATANNSTVDLSWEKGVLAGLDPFYLEAQAANGQNLQWTFEVPANYASGPILTILCYGSTSVGTFSYSALVRCVTPNAAEDWSTIPFDTANTDAAVTFTAGALETITIALANDDSMAAGDLCQLNFVQNSSGIVTHYLRGVINYTGS